MDRRLAPLVLGLAAALALSGACTVRGTAVETIGEMLASDQSAFTDDDDIELIGEALPFSLKLVDSLLTEAPDNRNLLLTAARGYVFYAYAYVQFPAEQAAADDLERARQLRDRARKLYLRAFAYAMRGLELDHPGLSTELKLSPAEAVARAGDGGVADVPFLYWSASALGLAISVSKDDPAMLARLPEVEALLDRALALDEAYDSGALYEFAVVWAGAVPGPDDRRAIDHNYERALELSAGRRASLYLAYAMAVSVPAQDRAQFFDLMERALAVDPDALRGQKLLNLIAQRRARWLLARVDELFLE